jgi:hypothetical protein
MPYLKMPNLTPPGGWRYFQPETRLWFDGTDQGFEDMVEKIVHHRQYRSLARTSRNEVVEDVNNQLCERLGPAHCRDIKPDGFYIKQDFTQTFSFSTVMAGSKALIDFIKNGMEQIAVSKVQQRAEICRSCHLNTPMTGCGSCSALGKTVAKLLPEERRAPGLNACAACGCSLPLKVNSTLETINKADEGRGVVYPENCFVTKERNASS